MRVLSTASLAILVATAGMTACGDDKGPAGPEADLVGTWIFEGTDLVEVLASRFLEYAVGQGMNRSDAEAIVDEAFATPGRVSSPGDPLFASMETERGQLRCPEGRVRVLQRASCGRRRPEVPLQEETLPPH